MTGNASGSLPRLGAQRRLLLLVAASAALQGLLLVPVPLVIRDIFDVAIPTADSQRLALDTIALIVVVTLSGGVAVLLRHHLVRLVQAHVADVRHAVAGALVTSSLEDLKRRSSEETREVVIQDSLRYSTALSVVAAQVLPSVLTAAAIAVVLLVLDPALFALSVVLIAPLVAANRLLGRAVRSDTATYHDDFADYSARTARLLGRAPVTRVHGAQHLELAQVDGAVSRLQGSAVRLDRSRSVYTWALQSVIVGSALLLLGIGGLGVISGSRSIGELFAFYAAIALIRPALDVVVQAMPAVTAGRLARGRLENLAELATAPAPIGSRPIDFSGRVATDGLGFSYGDGPVLRDVDIELRPGTVTVLRGPNGAGKTTLVHLLCGLLEPTSGRVLADGVNLADLDRHAVRRGIGVVFQDALVGGDTVEEALAFGDHTPSRATIEAALATTQFDRVLERLPHGMATPIGPECGRLSGGERQRLAIAQALVRSPRLLLLDEPTNHLDAEAVASVVADLTDQPDGPSVLVVTHEDSRRFRPDQIIELQPDGGTSTTAIARAIAHNQSPVI